MELQFFLDFIDTGKSLEIFEPFEADGTTISIKKTDKSFAFNLYKNNEDTEFLFTNGYFDKTTPYFDMQGKVVSNFGHGLFEIIDSYVTYGPEATIRLRIVENGVDFILGVLNLEVIESDLKTYFKCSTIEDNKRSLHKIREDLVVDIYSDKDLDGNAIIPLTPTKILLKAKPIVSISEFNNSANTFHIAAGFYSLLADTVIRSGIDSTVANIYQNISNASGVWQGRNNLGTFITNSDEGDFLKVAISKSKLTDITINLRLTGTLTTSDSASRPSYAMCLTYVLMKSTPDNFRENFNAGNYERVFNYYYNNPTDSNFNIDINVEDYNSNISLGTDETLYGFFTILSNNGTIDNTIESLRIYTGTTRLIFSDLDVSLEIKATSTSINSVIEGVKWIDYKKQASLISSGLPVNAPLFDTGGKYNNIYAINGYGIRGISGKPFSTKTIDALESSYFLGSDFQITENNIELGIYKDFLSSNKIGSFKVVPSEGFKFNTNKNYRLKSLDFGFKTFEQDRDEQKTFDSVHTSTQWMFPNRKAQNTKKIDAKPIVDYYKIETLRRLGIDPETKETSLENDDDLVLLDIVPLAPGHIETHTGEFNQQAGTTTLKILSTTFRWDRIGLVVGDSFTIILGTNAGSYTVSVIETTVLTLTGTAQTFTGIELISFQYTPTGVSFTNRTNEGFDSITGIISSDKSANLLLSIKRNFDNWLPLLATASMRYPNGVIKNTFWKNNSNLVTQFNGGPIYTDKADILVSEIAPLKRVTDRTFKTEFYAELNEVITAFEKINTRNPDGSIGGYFELYDSEGNTVNGYPIELTYLIKEGKFEGEFEEKYEGDYFDIVDADRTKYGWFEIYDIYVTLYSENDIELFTRKRFTAISINGVVYDTIEEFNNALTIYFG